MPGTHRTDRATQPVVIPPAHSSNLSHAGLVLEGLFVPGSEHRAVAVMAPPHPLYGGSMQDSVVTEVAAACHLAGLASLRFNWRGVGASAGTPTGDLEAGVADYAAALEFAEQRSEGSIAACGYSFGAVSAVSAISGHSRVETLLLVAPPLMMLDARVLQSFSGRILLVVGDRDEFAPLRELEEVCRELDNAELVPLVGTDHYFMSGLPELGRACEKHFQAHSS